MNRHDAALRQYYRRIWGWLPCSWKLKKQILAEIQASVEGYLEENPQADFDQVQARFGTPQTIAAAYVENLDTPSLLRSLRIRRRIVTTIGCIALVILASWTIYIAASIEHQAKCFPGYIEVKTEWADETSETTEETGVVRYYP